MIYLICSNGEGTSFDRATLEPFSLVCLLLGFCLFIYFYIWHASVSLSGGLRISDLFPNKNLSSMFNGVAVLPWGTFPFG